jgi:hypothetical protein
MADTDIVWSAGQATLHSRHEQTDCDLRRPTS